MISSKDPLFSEFPPVSTEEWEKIIKRDLKGADYKEKLKWHTGEGIEVLPFYRQENREEINRKRPLTKTFADDGANSWEVREPIFESSVDAANATMLEAMNRGADAFQLHMRVRRTEGALGGDLHGIAIQNQNDFENLLKGIPLDNVPLHFDAGMASPALLAMLRNESERQGIDPESIWATLGYDPFTFLLQRGYYPKKKSALYKDIKELVEATSNLMPGVRPLAVDARTFHDAGGTIVQELGYALSAASEYLSAATDQGISVDNAARCLHFSFSVGSNYFLEIAKFRAMRVLWKNLIDAYEGSTTALESGPYLHGETSRWNKTLYDPYSNMLRTSTESMAAAIAGCDSISVLPFDAHFQQPDTFSKRVARNQQIILDAEAYLDKVADPSAGSYYIEHLTDKLGQAAWKTFQEVETEGGLMKSIEHGTVQAAIQEARRQHDFSIATASRVFVGTNRYTNPDEKRDQGASAPVGTVSLKSSDDEYPLNGGEDTLEALAKAFADGAGLGDLIPLLLDYQKQQYRIIESYRGPEAFEALRTATEKHGTTPKVLLLPLGNRRMRKARARFASNFLGSAGYDIQEPVGFETMDKAVASVKENQPDIIVLCSSDEEYQKLVPELGKQLAELDINPITVLAGYPKDQIEQYKQNGIDRFIHAKSNVLEVLTDFQQQLGILGADEKKTKTPIDNL